MKITILGSGSWGSALAQVLVDNEHDVIIWGREQAEVDDIMNNHYNQKYFPDVKLNEKIVANTDFNVCKGSDIVLLAVPTMAIESVCQQLNNVLDQPVYIINVAKGFHPVTHLRLSEVIEKTMHKELLKDVISLIGPSHAEEVVLRQLTLVNAICKNEDSAMIIQELFSNYYFRVYRNTDVIGAETGVAIKNVMAIASGILAGLGEGDNARAALMTRGLAEMARYGLAMGGKAETYLGLTGVGDLIVTCTSLHSRNFQAGLAIGKSDSAKEFLATNTKTVEGIKTAQAVYEEAKKRHISMPITEQVYRVLFEDAKPSIAIELLMRRELKSEEIN